jgi:hypothetical protein
MWILIPWPSTLWPVFIRFDHTITINRFLEKVFYLFIKYVPSVIEGGQSQSAHQVKRRRLYSDQKKSKTF